MKPDYFKPTLQTKFNEEGNCLAACLVSLFEIDIDINDIPDFVLQDDNVDWFMNFGAWVAEHLNKFVISVAFNEYFGIELFRGSLLITSINSNCEHTDVERHAVITKNQRIIFDPMFGKVNRPLTSYLDPVFYIFSDIRTINEA